MRRRAGQNNDLYLFSILSTASALWLLPPVLDARSAVVGATATQVMDLRQVRRQTVIRDPHVSPRALSLNGISRGAAPCHKQAVAGRMARSLFPATCTPHIGNRMEWTAPGPKSLDQSLEPLNPPNPGGSNPETPRHLQPQTRA